MRQYILGISVFFFIVLFSCKDGQNAPDTLGDITLVNSEEAQILIQMENTQLVDVRTPEELEDGMIEGAVNLVYDKDFSSRLENLDKEKPVLVYCRSGNRSAKCVEILKKAGFQKIYDLDGGITQWTREGKPMVK